MQNNEITRAAMGDMPTMTSHKGYVYILSHPCMPGLLKIGSTDRPPERRARELSCSTAVPGAFVVEFEVFCANPLEVEHSVHAKLEADREDPKREFFRTNLSAAIDVVRAASGMPPTFIAKAVPAAPSSPIKVDVEFSYEFLEEIRRAPRLFQGMILRLQAILPTKMLLQLKEPTRRALRLPLRFRDSYYVNAFVDYRRTGTYKRVGNSNLHANILLADPVLHSLQSSGLLYEGIKWEPFQYVDIVDPREIAQYSVQIVGTIQGFVDEYRAVGREPGVYVSALTVTRTSPNVCFGDGDSLKSSMLDALASEAGR